MPPIQTQTAPALSKAQLRQLDSLRTRARKQWEQIMAGQQKLVGLLSEHEATRQDIEKLQTDQPVNGGGIGQKSLPNMPDEGQ